MSLCGQAAFQDGAIRNQMLEGHVPVEEAQHGGPGEDDLHAQPCENSYSGSRDKRSHGGGGIQPQPAQGNTAQHLS